MLFKGHIITLNSQPSTLNFFIKKNLSYCPKNFLTSENFINFASAIKREMRQ